MKSEAEKRIREALSVASIEPRDERFKVDTDDLTALLADHAEREAALRAEVERLKAAIDMQPSPPTREDMEWAGKVHLAEAEKENDALRAEVEALRRTATDRAGIIDSVREWARGVVDDNWALRAALTEAGKFVKAKRSVLAHNGLRNPEDAAALAAVDALIDRIDAALARAKEPK